MLNVLLIDDERRVRNHLKNTLLECGDVNILGEADDIVSARALIKANPNIDGIFLDIQLPGGTGFDIVPDIQDMKKVVFVTAYDQYAIRAFEVNALDYVMKPASQERLEQSLQRLRAHKTLLVESLEAESQEEIKYDEISSTTNLERQTTSRPDAHQNQGGLLFSADALSGTLLQEHDQLLLKFGTKNKFCSVKDVIFVRSADNYTEVHCADGAIALMRRTLDEWSASLPGAIFLRIHRSALINIRYISEVKQEAGGRLQLRLRGVEEELMVSRSYALAVKEAFSR